MAFCPWKEVKAPWPALVAVPRENVNAEVELACKVWDRTYIGTDGAAMLTPDAPDPSVSIEEESTLRKSLEFWEIPNSLDELS